MMNVLATDMNVVRNNLVMDLRNGCKECSCDGYGDGYKEFSCDGCEDCCDRFSCDGREERYDGYKECSYNGVRNIATNLKNVVMEDKIRRVL